MHEPQNLNFENLYITPINKKAKVKLETNVKFVVFNNIYCIKKDELSFTVECGRQYKNWLYNRLNCNRLVNTVNVMEYTVLYMYIMP